MQEIAPAAKGACACNTFTARALIGTVAVLPTQGDRPAITTSGLRPLRVSQARRTAS